MKTTRPLLIAAASFLVSAAAHGQETTEAYEDVDPYEELGLHSSDDSYAEDESVVDDDISSSGAVSAEPTEREFLREYANFVRLLEDQNFDEADISAKRVIQMAIQLYGPQSQETAKALNNLGVIQNNNRQYDAAMQNFSTAVEILETIEDRLNEQLVNPLKGLGAAQLGSGRPDLASKTYTRATHITHVNEGPHNIEQVEILESLAEAFVRLGDLDSARNVLDRMHILNVKHFSDDALGLLPSLMRRASWQHRAGYYNDERATYRRALRVIEDGAGKTDPRLVDPLIKLGQSFYYYEPLPDNMQRPLSSAATGEVYFKRANRIAVRNPNFPWLERAAAALALADYYVVKEQYSRANKIYTDIWEELSGDDSRLEMRKELLEQPHPIWEEALPAYTNSAAGMAQKVPGEIQIGSVTVAFQVTQKGRVRIENTVSDPPEFTDMQRMAQREVKGRVYRPKIADGESVSSDTQTFRHEFRYRRSELEELREKNREKMAEST
jgi:tetratricopeptide (TPR) repeat protein